MGHPPLLHQLDTSVEVRNESEHLALQPPQVHHGLVPGVHVRGHLLTRKVQPIDSGLQLHQRALINRE